jgi:hypothetical protein
VIPGGYPHTLQVSRKQNYWNWKSYRSLCRQGRSHWP